MFMKNRSLFASLLLAATACTGALAQTYPDKPINVIVPFNPGGTSDTVMRAIAGKMAEALGQQVVVDNKAGAGGGIGATLVARAAPDGYTLLIAPIGTFAIAPYINKSMKYEPRRDFDLLTIPVRTPNVLVASPGFPANSFKELIAYMKANPGKVSFANSGTGTTDHLSAALVWKRTGTTGIHVAYKGAGPALTDLMAGHVNVLITNFGNVSSHIKAGKIKPLAVTAQQRIPELPQVPTFTENGIDDFVIYGWQGIAGPKGMPPAVNAKLHSAIVGALKDPDVTRQLESLGFQVHGSTSQEFARELDRETVRWKSIIEAEGIVVE
ncbi:Bug family tripartite tricarboxylate transporter substrate binding protein [Piscinibacter sakaiensis]|uniref:Bug family tripartite tricarboxylate transporter substrate binding protein n=1 Tax=Piscinibacter sakaiensis TaxID=1547922 RepID=UPI003AADF565